MCFCNVNLVKITANNNALNFKEMWLFAQLENNVFSDLSNLLISADMSIISCNFNVTVLVFEFRVMYDMLMFKNETFCCVNSAVF